MTDWSTIASLATAGGTLVLGVATFASVRSAHQAARVAERSLLAAMRPLLFASMPGDPALKINWGDQHLTKVEAGQGTVEVTDDVVYMTINLRNAGTGMAVLHGWRVWGEWRQEQEVPDLDSFRRQNRDLYVPPQGTGYWQGAIREVDDPDFEPVAKRGSERERFTIDLLYGDIEGGQRTITRFGMMPLGETAWLAAVGRHWHIDRADPR